MAGSMRDAAAKQELVAAEPLLQQSSPLLEPCQTVLGRFEEAALRSRPAQSGVTAAQDLVHALTQAIATAVRGEVHRAVFGTSTNPWWNPGHICAILPFCSQPVF